MKTTIVYWRIDKRKLQVMEFKRDDNNKVMITFNKTRWVIHNPSESLFWSNIWFEGKIYTHQALIMWEEAFCLSVGQSLYPSFAHKPSHKDISFLSKVPADRKSTTISITILRRCYYLVNSNWKLFIIIYPSHSSLLAQYLKLYLSHFCLTRGYQFFIPVAQGRIVFPWDLLRWANHIKLFQNCAYLLHVCALLCLFCYFPALRVGRGKKWVSLV